MVRGATAETGRGERGGLTEPSFRRILLDGLPGLLRESVVPLAAFVAGSKLGGLAIGIGCSAAASVLIYLSERRAGRDALLLRLTLAFVALQSVVGFAAQSATAYLSQPVLINAAFGLAFLGSVAACRPLAGALACAWYPFPASFRATDRFKRVFGVESVVGGCYLLGRGALRLTVLLSGTLTGFLAVVILTGTPLMLVLVAWSIDYAIRQLTTDGEEAPTAGPATGVAIAQPVR